MAKGVVMRPTNNILHLTEKFVDVVLPDLDGQGTPRGEATAGPVERIQFLATEIPRRIIVNSVSPEDYKILPHFAGLLDFIADSPLWGVPRASLQEVNKKIQKNLDSVDTYVYVPIKEVILTENHN